MGGDSHIGRLVSSAVPAGASREVAGILKTLDTGRYDDKNGLNKVRNESMLLKLMLGCCAAKRTGNLGAK